MLDHVDKELERIRLAGPGAVPVWEKKAFGSPGGLKVKSFPAFKRHGGKYKVAGTVAQPRKPRHPANSASVGGV